VVRLEAEVLEVVEEANRYIASVHFQGLIREDRQDSEAFSEVWHLVKPTEGGGWVIAGIQQVQ
jgi:predicted lipid-binding transport protein (Tim44 family)